MFARIASCLMNRAKSSLISFSDIVIYLCIIGAVAGLEPANRRKTQLTLHRQHDTPYIYSLIQAAGSHTSLRHTTQSPSALLDLQSGFRISIVLYVARSSQPFSLQFSQLPSDLHYYLSVQYVAVSQQPSRTNS